MLPPHTSSISLDKLFSQVERTLLQIWKETGYGNISLESQKIDPNCIQIIFRGTAQYHYIIPDEAIQQAICNGSSCYPFMIESEFVNQLENLLLQIWQETGYGHLIVNSQRSRKDKISLTLQGAPSYRFFLPEDQVKYWTSKL